MRRIVIILVAAGVVLLIAISLWSSGPDIPDRGVLLVEVGGPLEEAPPTDGLSRLFARGPALATLALQIEKASADDRIVGIALHVRPLQVGYARIQELRAALQRARGAGKRVVAFLDLGQLNATREVYLASAADRVYVAPGYLGPVVGIAGELLHMGGMFAKAGIQIEYERIGAYKSAPEALAERGMSEPAREMMETLFDGLYEQLVAGIAEGRNLEPEAVRELIDQAPATPDEYLTAGLADAIAGKEQLLEVAGFEGAERVSVQDYMPVDPRDLGLRNGPAIALIFGDGMIVPANGSGLRRAGFAGDQIARALEDAAEDEDVRAIVLRVNSGGGSYQASDQIWRAVREARERKPVVVSMADAAASGGYYVASAADAIVAEPATLTGSIGIYLTRIALRGVYKKLDIGAEVMTRGRYADLVASGHALSPAHRERLRSFLEASYREFLERVSDGRGLSTEEVDALGQGRIWLGREAREKGLVDEIGGLYAAVARAKAEAGIPPEEDPRRVIFPGPRSFREQMNDLLSGFSRGDLWLELFPIEIPEMVRAWRGVLDGEIAYLPPYWIVFH